LYNSESRLATSIPKVKKHKKRKKTNFTKIDVEQEQDESIHNTLPEI